MARTVFRSFAGSRTPGTVSPARAAAAEWVCPRCGLQPVELHPVDSAGAVRSLFVRFGVLFRHADPGALRRCRPEPGSPSAVGHAQHAADALAALDDHLRALIGDALPGSADASTDVPVAAAEASESEPARVLDALTRTGTRLARTIIGATDADWRQAATIGGLRPLELVHRTLHEAFHHLHDAERLGAAPAFLVRPVELATPGGRPLPPPPPEDGPGQRRPPLDLDVGDAWPAAAR